MLALPQVPPLSLSRTGALQVKNNCERRYPTNDTDMNEVVLQQHLCWIPAFSVNQGDLHIAHDPCQYKNRCDIQIVAAHALYHFVGHSIENVAYDGDAAQNANGLVEEIHVVALNVLSCLYARCLVYRCIVATFRHGQEECKQKRGEYYPV